ncbi:GDYXXLXY domain-containing protein [Nocardioides sp.]|uniref:GDYXXLXY domain-containing protein n=1 Tax=Nocardioides sp. TaxID=35761 RepID=UPI002ED1A5F7
MISMVRKVGVVSVTGLALAAVAVYPQLSARLTGEEIRLRVAPVDPIDPFRGAYVDLQYPDLRLGGPDPRGIDDGDSGDVYLTLRPKGDVWVADSWTRTRPEDGTYLACTDHTWRVRCGIESWFLPQDEAAEMEEAVGDGAIATVRVDDRGHAALVDVEG